MSLYASDRTYHTTHTISTQSSQFTIFWEPHTSGSLSSSSNLSLLQSIAGLCLKWGTVQYYNVLLLLSPLVVGLRPAVCLTQWVSRLCFLAHFDTKIRPNPGQRGLPNPSDIEAYIPNCGFDEVLSWSHLQEKRYSPKTANFVWNYNTILAFSPHSSQLVIIMRRETREN